MTALDISDLTGRYAQLNGEYTKARAELRAEIKKALEGIVKRFLAANPNVASISWRQYTPYFQDGDACVFEAEEPIFTLKDSIGGASTDDADEDEDEDGDYEDHSDLLGSLRYAKGEGKTAILAQFESLGGQEAYEKIVSDFKVVKAFVKSIDDDHLEDLYDDHVQVVCTRDGIEALEYMDHD